MEDYSPTPDTQDPKKEFSGFKEWFKLEFQNQYILLFFIGLTGTIVELCMFGKVIQMISDNAQGDGGGIFTVVGMLVCPAIMIIVIFKGFIQYWQDMRNGTSR